MTEAYKFLERVSNTSLDSEGETFNDTVSITDAHHAIKIALLDSYHELNELQDFNQVKAYLRDKIDYLKRKNFLAQKL